MIAAGTYGGVRIIFETEDEKMYSIIFRKEQIEQLLTIANTELINYVGSKMADMVKVLVPIEWETPSSEDEAKASLKERNLL